MAGALGDSSAQMNCDSNECDLIASKNVEISQQCNEILFEIEEDEDCGRFLVAKQNISQGELILIEQPTGISLNTI